MGGGAWKVAYADFVTAMMAFFLLMWILSMTSADTKAMLAGIFKGDLQFNPDVISPIGISNNPLIDHAGKITVDDTVVNEHEKVEIKMIQQINQFLLKDALPTGSSGITSDGIGVLLHLTPEVLFKPGTVEFTPKGQGILDEVSKILSMYKAYLVVRGHADASETDSPYTSKWELSSARANAAINYLLKAKVDPSFLRSVAYADTRPAVDEADPTALQQNARLEFHFHRPEAMSTIVGY